MGEMLFTHFGVSGPLVLTASTYLKRELSCYHMEIDLKPALDSFQLEQRVLRDFEKYQDVYKRQVPAWAGGRSVCSSSITI